MASQSKTGGRKGSQYSQPFPRDLTRKVTTQGVTKYTSHEEAIKMWNAWLRVLSGVSQMKLPPRHRVKE